MCDREASDASALFLASGAEEVPGVAICRRVVPGQLVGEAPVLVSPRRCHEPYPAARFWCAQAARSMLSGRNPMLAMP